MELSEKQREAVAHLSRSKKAIAWWRVGEGKTRIALAWVSAICPAGRTPRVLIICSPGAIRTWEDEIALVGAEIDAKFLSYGMLAGGKAENRAVDFEATDALIIDELWMYKSVKTNRSKRVAELSRVLPTIGLSGSMVTARNIEDLWGQAKAVGLAGAIAPNLTAFRREFCVETLTQMGLWIRFVERTPKPGAVEAIQKRLAGNIHVHFPKETRDSRDIFIDVAPSKDQLAVKRALAREYFFAHEDDSTHGFTVEVKSAAALLIKLQQVSYGVVKDDAGHASLVDSPKAKRFREIVSELVDAGERVLVWVAFRRTLDFLRTVLAPHPVVALSSENDFDAEAWAGGEAKICLATVGSGASLNDFASVRYSVFYSSPFSHLMNQQARGRTLRASSDSPLVHYHVLHGRISGPEAPDDRVELKTN